MRPRVLCRLVVAVLMLAAVAACGGQPDFKLTNVTGKMPDLKLFGVPSSTGKARTAADYSGQIVVLFFGYTHCPDVCPLTLSKLHSAMQTLDDKAKSVQVLFVTVDPSRDTQPVIGRYVNAFDSRFGALRPTGAKLKSLTKRYNAGYSYDKPDASGSYAVTHSSAIYIFDGSGTMRLIGSSADSADVIAADLGTLAANAGG